MISLLLCWCNLLVVAVLWWSADFPEWGSSCCQYWNRAWTGWDTAFSLELHRPAGETLCIRHRRRAKHRPAHTGSVQLTPTRSLPQNHTGELQRSPNIQQEEMMYTMFILVQWWTTIFILENLYFVIWQYKAIHSLFVSTRRMWSHVQSKWRLFKPTSSQGWECWRPQFTPKLPYRLPKCS